MAEASVLIRPDTTKFAALLEAELIAATRGVTVAIPVAAVPAGAVGATAATESLVASQQAAEASTLGLASAAQVENAAFVKQTAILGVATTATEDLTVVEATEAAAARLAGATHQRAAISTLTHARAQGQLERGAAATGLSLLGIRGATLAASSSFLAGAAAVTILAKSIAEASAEQEALARVERVLGEDTSKKLEASARGLAGTFGLSATEALRAEGAFAELFHNVGISNERAGALSQQFVKLAADMAAFNNVPIETTLKAIQLGIAGNTRGLKQYGIILNQSAITQEALRESGKKFATELTRQELVLARVKLILADTANQQGAFAARSGDLAGQSRILRANLADISAEIGSALLPALVSVTTDINLVIGGFQRLNALRVKLPEIPKIPGGGGIFNTLAKTLSFDLIPAVGSTIVLLKGADAAIHLLAGSEKEASTSAQAFTRDSGDAAAAVARLGEAAQHVTTPLHDVAAALQGLEVQQLKIQTGITPGGRGAEEANLKQQIADDQRVVALAASGTKARRDALEKLRSDQQELQALQDQAASDAQTAASKIQAARDKQDQALLDIFGAQQARIQNLLTRAQGNRALGDDIKFTQDLRRLLIQQRAEAKKRIKDLQLRAQTIAADTAQILELQNRIRELQRQQREALKAQREQRIADRREILEINLQIAQARDNRKAEIAAEKALIADDIRKLNFAKKHNKSVVEQKRLALQLAQDLADLRALQKKEREKGRSFAQDTFAFLQTQQGFVSNLLGNLIPGGAGGLVGGGGGGEAPRQISGGFEQPHGVITGTAGGGIIAQFGDISAQAVSQKRLAPTSGQANTQIDILRKILSSIQHLGRTSEHPEAKKQRYTGSAAMDFHIQGTYGM